MSANDGNSALAKSRFWLLLLLAVGITLLFVTVIRGFLLALVMAAVLAGIAGPTCDRLTSLLRGRRGLAAVLTVLLTVVIIIVPGMLILGMVMQDAAELSEKLKPWLEQQLENPGELQRAIESSPALKELLPYQDEIVAKAGQIAGSVAAFVARAVVGGATGAVEFFLMLFVTLYAMLYFLREGRAIIDGVFEHTPLTAEDQERLTSTFASVSRATIRGTLVIGIVQGALAGVAFAVAGIEGAMFWGTIMAVLSIIPGIGSALVWVPAVIYLALNGRIESALLLGAWCAVVVGTIDNVLRPLLVGQDTKMPDLLILLTTLGGLTLFGATGIVIGPIVGALFMTAWALWGAAVEADRQGDASCD